MAAKGRTKIIIQRQHVGYVNTALKKEFQQKYQIENFASWVRDVVYGTFEISLWSASDIKTLVEKVSERYYQGVGEWLDDCMRRKVLECDVPTQAETKE